jgi:hypothetical protein
VVPLSMWGVLPPVQEVSGGEDWYTYCIGLAMYDLFAWGNGGPGAWHRGHSTTAGVPASLFVSLPEFGNLPQWLVSFSGANEGKRGYNEGALG